VRDREKERGAKAELGFGGGANSYRPSWAAASIWDVDTAAADRVTPSQPRSCLRRTTTSSAYLKRYGAGWVPDRLPSWAGLAGFDLVSHFSFFFCFDSFFHFLFSDLNSI
jgi:hypothetical protein